jgi:hypothetical protein
VQAQMAKWQKIKNKGEEKKRKNHGWIELMTCCTTRK